MDSSSVTPQVDLSTLSQKDKQELQQFMNNEMQKATLQQCTSCLLPRLAAMLLTQSIAVHSITDVCWKKCITGKISGGKLDRSEESCTQNCVDRFMDGNLLILKRLGAMQREGL